jgi:nucleotidyltransferase substrate binding protein (TIGR01987 family)
MKLYYCHVNKEELTMGLDFSSFQKALASLERAIQRSQQNSDDSELRDAVIQRFEYTYELSWKMLKRQIERESASPATVDTLSFRDLIREGAERGLVNNPEKWFIYRDQRNITSHTYDEVNAKTVYQTALEFYPDAQELFTHLKNR